MAIGRHFIQGIATEPWMFYMGPIVDMIGGYSNSVARALISKCVGLNDLGKVLAMISSMEALIPIGVTQLYVWIWTVSVLRKCVLQLSEICYYSFFILHFCVIDN